jgi:hypothetical protein
MVAYHGSVALDSERGGTGDQPRASPRANKTAVNRKVAQSNKSLYHPQTGGRYHAGLRWNI